jgi:hypothetical protein
VNAIIKRPPPLDRRQEYIFAMWLMFCRAPGHKTAPGEIVDLGEIGSVPEQKTWERLNPYAVATPK